MDDSTLEVLKNIGVPVAIISAAFVTAMLRVVHKKLAIASGIITLISVSLYIPIELIPKARDAISSTSIDIEPDLFHAFTETGKPISVTASCTQGDSIVDTFSSALPDYNSWKNRLLALRPHETEQAFYVMSNGHQLGKITYQMLANMGYGRINSIEPCSKPYFLASSKKVYVNSSWPIGDTGTILGRLTLNFTKIEAGKAVVSLESSQMPLPKPDSLSISNKSFDTQTFESSYEVTVQVREANFEIPGKEWAAFNIIVFE